MHRLEQRGFVEGEWALTEMGGLTPIRRDLQRVRIGAGIDALWQDFRLACRSLIRKPAFAVVAIVTFALGIGANSAIFSVVNATLIQPRTTCRFGESSGYHPGRIREE